MKEKSYLRPQGGGATPLLVSYPHLQDEICDGLRKGLSIKEIFEAIRVKSANYYLWMEKGRKQLRGVYRDFYEAVERAKEERWGTTKHHLERIVLEDALTTQVVVDRKVTRVLSLTRDEWDVMREQFEDDEALAARFDSEGIIVKEELIKRQQLPNSARALQILERRAVRDWGKK